MPTVSESPDTSATDTPETPATETQEASPLADLSGVMGAGHQPARDEGQQVAAEAVDEGGSEAPDDSAAETTTDDAGEPAAEVEGSGDGAEVEDKPVVNFDGFDDETKKYWEQQLEGGHATAEFVEQQRKNTMFHADYTRKRMAEAEKVTALEERVAANQPDLDLLEQIRNNPQWNAAWLKMANGEMATEPSESDDEFVDGRSAAQIAEDTYRRLKAEEQAEAESKQSVYGRKENAVRGVIADTIVSLGVTPEVMQSYLKVEQDLLPEGVDPVMDLTPAEIQRRVVQRHELVTAKARAAALEKQLSQRTSKDARTSKQSTSPPTARTDNTELSVSRQTEVDLGLTPNWGNVQGFGFRDV